MTLDLVLSVGPDVLGAVLVARQDVAVLVTQQLTAPAGAESVCMAELPLDDAVDELLTANGIGGRLARRLVTHLQPVVGNGQTRLATRGGYANSWRRVGLELRWLDTERARFQLLDADGGDWLSVNPMHAGDLSVAVRELARSLRG